MTDTFDIGHQLELASLYELVDRFAAAMKERLRQKHAEGAAGWNDPSFELEFRDQMVARAMNGYEDNEIDVANFAAFIWNLREQRA